MRLENAARIGQVGEIAVPHLSGRPRNLVTAPRLSRATVDGVPSAVRFGELGMFRGSYSFNLFDQYRLDLFLDHAGGRDSQTDNLWRQVTGTGIRVNLRTPRNTILQVDFGKSILPDVYRGAGSTVLQVLLLKPL